MNAEVTKVAPADRRPEEECLKYRHPRVESSPNHVPDMLSARKFIMIQR